MNHTITKTLSSVFLLALASTPLTAQKTYLVDQNNGPGTDYTRLQPAIDAAKPGDRVLVRNGLYMAPQITKGITVMAFFGGARIQVRSNLARISGIPAGQKCAFAGFIFEGAVLNVERCKGTVALTGLANARGFSPLPTINIVDCAAVTLHGCALKSTINIIRSRVFMSDSFLMPTLHAGGVVFGTGVTVLDGQLDVSSCIIRGGDALSALPGSPAITISGASLLRVRGDAKTRISGGLRGRVRLPSISGRNGAKLELDPRVTLAGRITGFSSRSIKKSVSLSAGYSFLTAKTGLRLHGRQAEIGAVFVGIWGAVKSWPGIGEWWLDSRTEVLLGAGVFGANERLDILLQQSTDARLRGLQIGYQGFVLTKQNRLEFSNPVLQVAR